MVLIGYGLSLEGVAEVDQEGLPGEGGAKAGFEETTELLKWRHQDFPGCPVVLEVQWLCLCASNAGGTTSTPGHRVNILLTMQHRKNISNAGTSVTNVSELHGG